MDVKRRIFLRILQIISVIFLILTSIVKFGIIDVTVNENILHYFFNATIIITVFSILYPLLSHRRLKSLNILESEYLNSILNEIDEKNVTHIYLSKEFMSDNVVTLLSKNKQVIICGEKIVRLLEKDQMKFILAHELYHIKKNHLFKNLFSFVFVMTGVPIFLLLFSSFLQNKISILFILLFSVIIFLTAFVMHFRFSQQREFAADKYAASLVGKTRSLETLIALQQEGLSKERSFSLLETHPSLKRRIQRVNDYKY